jgi:VanZ family protein
LAPFQFTADRDVISLKLSRLSPNPLREVGGERVSIVDSVENILLFLPFGVFGVLAGVRARRAGLGRIIFVTALGAALSVSVETLQLFTRDRISSTSDAFMNTVGTFLGAIAASGAKGVYQRGLRAITRPGLIDPKTFFPVMVATILVCLAAWEPFDVTLDVGSVVSKLRDLQHDVWQYHGLTDEGVSFMYHALFAAAVCAWLHRRGLGLAAVLAMAVGVSLSFGLESSKLFIGSRMPALEKAVVSSAGVLIGCVLWSLGRRTQAHGPWLALLAAGTAAGAALQMLSPFEFTAQRHPVQWLPFTNDRELTTFNMLSHTIELMLIYFPLGFCFAAASRRRPRATAAVVLAVILAIAVPIEYLQGWMVGRVPDVTDPCLSVVGGWLGVWAASRGASLFSGAVTSLAAGRRHERVPLQNNV